MVKDVSKVRGMVACPEDLDGTTIIEGAMKMGYGLVLKI